jgi:predicted phosphodiesterase
VIRSSIAALLLGTLSAIAAPNPESADPKPGGGDGREGRKNRGEPQGASRGHGSTVFDTAVPEHPADLVLGRPTGNSITASVLTYQDSEATLAYGVDPGPFTGTTQKSAFRAGQPVEIPITGLKPDTRYHFELRLRKADGTQTLLPGRFQTARPTGRPFTFVVQADPHLDENTIPARYTQSLHNMVSDEPDFLIDLGDTFMTDKYRGAYELAEKHYLAQRHYLGIPGANAAVFLVLGNHDGERGTGSRREEEGLWSNRTRKKYFPNPVPDAFYSGNATPHPKVGLLQDYAAWHWGDALFVTLDPFWFTGGDGRHDHNLWTRSLGRAQYDWLQRTLESSRARYKLVFIHHLVGGASPDARGGAEAAPFFEWGGKNADGTEAFHSERPGWPTPIHQLLVKHGVQMVFHGHDHLYAHQERDGIVYQCVPQPGNRGDGAPPRNAAEYSYASGTLLGSPGYLRVHVTPDSLKTELVRSYEPAAQSSKNVNRAVAHSYSIPFKRP